MAQIKVGEKLRRVDDETIQIRSFEIENLFGYLNHNIVFPRAGSNPAQPEMLILEGQNGTGKTTILQMIAGIINSLDFDPFRRVPFASAKLTLTNNKAIHIERTGNEDFPLIVTFDGITAELHKEKGSSEYTAHQDHAIDEFRSASRPFLNVIDFELITIERSLQLMQSHDEEHERIISVAQAGRYGQKWRSSPPQLAERVMDFLREAQVNHKKFFETSHLNLLPSIISRLQSPVNEPKTDELINRISTISSNNERLSKFGLNTDDSELLALRSFVGASGEELSTQALQILQSYVEINERQQAQLSLLEDRIRNFEAIMDEFFVGKIVRVSRNNGLDISSSTGHLNERDLSSGEYHFLYMMVSALLCQRRGTVLAIDEPELSLHVSWQRKLVAALTKCASGAAPLFSSPLTLLQFRQTTRMPYSPYRRLIKDG